MGLFGLFRGKPAHAQAKPDNDWAAITADGEVDGRHYSEWPDTVRQLKRDGRLAEAEQLLLKLCDAADQEAEAGGWYSPAPWYYEQLAIIYRKTGDFTKEVATLERYGEKLRPVDGRLPPNPFEERLRRARALLVAKQHEPESFCPYCGVEIAPLPKSRRNCPTCGETVVVAKRVGEEAVSLLTLEQAEDNKRLVEATRAERKAGDRVRKLGFQQSDVERTASRLAATWGTRPRRGDVVWSLSNEAVLSASRRADWAALARAYQVQADVLEEEGRATLDADQRASDALLRYYDGVCQSVDLPREVIVSTRKACCPECAKRSGEIVRIADAHADKALPNRACTNARCRCSWRVDYRNLREQ